MAGMDHILPRGVSGPGGGTGPAVSPSPGPRSSAEGSPVPVCRARPITLTAAERHRLKALAYSHTAAYQQVIRAHIVRCSGLR